MDVAEINKVGSRKRMSADVEKLREKVSKENKKIIKLKVAQDTAYWDLKERLRQVETNHEKLQQNMLEVQMQYETVSGQYQDELRHRAETLNKLASTREICSVLEEYCERLRDTLSRCKTDQAALYEAYQQSGQVLREMKTEQLQHEEKNKQIIENLQDKLKLTTEHHNQLLQYFSEEKQRAGNELQDFKEKLTVAVTRSNELTAANSEIGAQLEVAKRELEKKEGKIVNLQRDIKQLIHEFNSQACEMKSNMVQLEKDLKESVASNENLKQALTNQEEFTKTVCDQSNQLQEKLASMEDELINKQKIMVELEATVEEVKNTCDVLKNEGELLIEKNEKLEKEISDKNELLANSETELKKLTDQLLALDLEKSEILAAFERAGVEAKALIAKIQELTETSLNMETKIQEIEDSMKADKEAANDKIKDLMSTIETKDKDLECKNSTILTLMNDVKNVSDAKDKLEVAIQKIKQELVEEKDSAAEKESRWNIRLKQLEISVKNKDIELSKNLSVILELRNDKERLNEIIQNMQNKIDNVQKELTRPATPPPRIEPEQDDNAVMLTPAPKRSQPPPRIQAEFPPPAPKKDPKNDNLLFNFLSDSSLEGDIDPSYVNRRFDAVTRGERLTPMQMSAMRRRRTATPIVQGGLRQKTPAKDEEMRPLSEVKPKPRAFFKTKRHDKMKH